MSIHLNGKQEMGILSTTDYQGYLDEQKNATLAELKNLTIEDIFLAYQLSSIRLTLLGKRLVLDLKNTKIEQLNATSELKIAEYKRFRNMFISALSGAAAAGSAFAGPEEVFVKACAEVFGKMTDETGKQLDKTSQGTLATHDHAYSMDQSCLQEYNQLYQSKNQTIDQVQNTLDKILSAIQRAFDQVGSTTH